MPQTWQASAQVPATTVPTHLECPGDAASHIHVPADVVVHRAPLPLQQLRRGTRLLLLLPLMLLLLPLMLLLLLRHVLLMLHLLLRRCLR